LIGSWPPGSYDGTKRDLYEALILPLFNPWRNIKRLKKGHSSFAEAFMDFKDNMLDEVHMHIENIQAFYKCDTDSQENVEP